MNHKISIHLGQMQSQKDLQKKRKARVYRGKKPWKYLMMDHVWTWCLHRLGLKNLKNKWNKTRN